MCIYMPIISQPMQLRNTKNSSSGGGGSGGLESNVSFNFSLILQFYISFMEMYDAVRVTSKLNNQLYAHTHTHTRACICVPVYVLYHGFGCGTIQYNDSCKYARTTKHSVITHSHTHTPNRMYTNTK